MSFSNPTFYLFWQKQTKNAKREEFKSKEEPSSNKPTLLSDMATQNSFVLVDPWAELGILKVLEKVDNNFSNMVLNV